MKKTMFIGKSGAGKTTLIQALTGAPLAYAKTPALEFSSSILDTPGEYLESRFYYKALMVSSADYDLIVFVQAADDMQTAYPDIFSSMFGKETVGAVTKTDISPELAGRAAELLRNAGCQAVFELSAVTGEGVEALRSYIWEDAS